MIGFIFQVLCFKTLKKNPFSRQIGYLGRHTWGEGGAGSTGGEAAPLGLQGRRNESWGWSGGEPNKGANGV